MLIEKSVTCNFRFKFWPLIGLVAVAFILYAHYIRFSFLPYDDNFNIYANPHLLAGGWLYFWKNSYVNLYIPVTYTVWTWVYKLFGTDAAAFHFVNIFVHALNVILIFLIFNRLNFSKMAAFLGALFFLIHPLQVEAVAWVTSLKDVLSFFFVLLTLWTWLFFPRQRKFAIAFFYMALFAKPSVVILPFFLAWISFSQMPSGTSFEKIKTILKKEKWLVIASLSVLPIIYFTSRSQTAEVNLAAMVSPGQRFVIVLDAIGFYIRKILIPTNLYSDYGRTPQSILTNQDYYLNLALALVFLIFLIGFIRSNYRKPGLKNIWLFLGFAVCAYLPISGVLSFGYQSHSTTADRYMYPVLFAVAGLVSWSYDRYLQARGRILFKWMLVCYFGVLGFTGYLQSLNWKNTDAYYEFCYEGTPQAYSAVHNKAVSLQRQGNIAESMPLFFKAMQLNPKKLPPLAGVVSNYFKQKNYDAMDMFAKKYLTVEKLKNMSPSPDSLLVIYQAYTVANLERQKLSKALTILCIADEVVAKPNKNFEELLSDTRQKVAKKDQYCPHSLAEAQREVF